MTSLDTTPSRHGGATISSVHPDIMKTHILPRLDGPSLVSAACSSSELHALSSDHALWQNICSATWPSTDDPRVRDVISAFPSGHRSFFSDSFPDLPGRRSPPPEAAAAAAGLISAVDVFYRGKVVFSRVHESDTGTSWFSNSPFRVDLVGYNESVPVPVRHGGIGDAWLRELEHDLTVSWILIDPTQNRSANISGRVPVSVTRHWLTGDVQIRYGTVFAAGKAEAVNCGVVVTCGGKEGGEMHVSEMSMQVEDMDGKTLNGRDSSVILRGAISSGRRKRTDSEGQNGKSTFNEFEVMKARRRARVQKIERTLDLVCIATGVTAFVSFWSFVLFG